MDVLNGLYVIVDVGGCGIKMNGVLTLVVKHLLMEWSIVSFTKFLLFAMGFIWIGCNLALVLILNYLLSSPNSSFLMHVWKICRWFGRWTAWLGDGKTYLGWEKFGLDSIPSFNYGNQQNLSHQLQSWYSTVLFGSLWKLDRYYGSYNAFSHVFVSVFLWNSHGKLLDLW